MPATIATRNTTDGATREKPSARPRAVAHTDSRTPESTSTIQATRTSEVAVLSLSGYGAARPEAPPRDLPPRSHTGTGPVPGPPGTGPPSVGGLVHPVGAVDPTWAGQVGGVDDRVRVALLGEEALPVGGVLGVEGVAADHGVEVRLPAVGLGAEHPAQPLGLLLPRPEGPRHLDGV